VGIPVSLGRGGCQLLPIIVIENFITAFGLNISLYFTKVDHLHFNEVGKLISVFYAGFFVGAVGAGPLTLNKNPVTMTGLGLLLQSLGLANLLVASDPVILNSCMAFLGLTASFISVNALTALFHDEVLQKRLFKTFVRTSQDLPNSVSKGKSIYDSLKTSTAKEDIDLLAREILERSVKQNLTQHEIEGSHDAVPA
jgi:hypothetical protein